jgi:hypothetical protein
MARYCGKYAADFVGRERNDFLFGGQGFRGGGDGIGSDKINPHGMFQRGAEYFANLFCVPGRAALTLKVCKELLDINGSKLSQLYASDSGNEMQADAAFI